MMKVFFFCFIQRDDDVEKDTRGFFLLIFLKQEKKE